MVTQIGKSVNDNNPSESEVEYLEFIDTTICVLEALLIDPLDESALERAAAIVRSVREE